MSLSHATISHSDLSRSALGLLGSPRLLFRLISIARTLARHDALAPLEEAGIAPGVAWLARLLSRSKASGRPGEKLARALTELGPSFIKLGQFLSTRADLLGEELAADLARLQDRLPPFSAKEARAAIESELGAPLESFFSSFDETPVSAASIAQVHYAVTREPEGGEAEGNSGREVAVKVLRPGVEAAFARDLDLFLTLARLAERSQPRLRRLKPVKVVGLFEATVRVEMDLRMEAAAASQLAENFADDPSYRVPPVDWQRSARRVLTQGRLTGIRMDDRAALLAAGHDLEDVLTKAARIFFNQVFRDGFFHGDQHPGNMFVDAEGNIGAVDFGIMGQLDRETRYFLADMLLATLARDYRRLAQVHADAGYLPKNADLETFARALRSVCEPIFGRPLNEISFAQLLAQLFQLTESFQMAVQPQLLLLQKNMLMAEGISRQLEPSLNIWILAQPLIEQWMSRNRGPEARMREVVQDLASSLESLPRVVRNLDQATETLAKGGLKLHGDTTAAFGQQQSRLPYHQIALWAVVALLLLVWALD